MLGVHWSMCGTRIATASECNRVAVFDATLGDDPETLGHTAECLAFSPDGDRLATGDNLPSNQGPNSITVVIWSAKLLPN